MTGSKPVSLAVDDPEIVEVQHMDSGEVMPAERIIGSDYGAALKLRMALRESIVQQAPLYTCPMCGIPVYLVSRRETRRFFFRHDLEDGRCPARTRGRLSEEEINARKYNGAKESTAHRRLKEIIMESLAVDPRFDRVLVEKTWKGQERGVWRRPDVQAHYGDLHCAFEIQLSTTFLRVIAERRQFYLREGGLLTWIFGSFDDEFAPLTQEDIFYNNNRNLFIANETTLLASKQKRRFTLECRWAKPYAGGGTLQHRWANRLVGFDQLIVDRTRQRVFFFDYDTEVGHASQVAVCADLRARFEAYWLKLSIYDRDNGGEWAQFRKEFAMHGFDLPHSPHAKNGPGDALGALYSARHGRPVYWNYDKLVQVAHRMYDANKDLLWLFRRALETYGRGPQILREDGSKKWRAKVKDYLPRMQANDPAFAPNHEHDALIAFLFLEISLD